MTAGKGEKKTAYGSSTGIGEPSENGGEREETPGSQSREDSNEGKTGGTEKSRDGVDRTNSQTRGGYGADRYGNKRVTNTMPIALTTSRSELQTYIFNESFEKLMSLD